MRTYFAICLFLLIHYVSISQVLKGRVVDKDSNEPLKGVKVFSDNLSAATDSNGMFMISEIPQGTHEITMFYPVLEKHFQDNIIYDTTITISGNIDTVFIPIQAKIDEIPIDLYCDKNDMNSTLVELTCSRLFYSDSMLYANLIIRNNSSNEISLIKKPYHFYNDAGFGIDTIFYDSKEHGYMGFSNYLYNSILWLLPEMFQKIPFISIPPGSSMHLDSICLADTGWYNHITNKWNPQYFTISYLPLPWHSSIPKDSIGAFHKMYCGNTENTYCKMYKKKIQSNKIPWMKAP